jgi:hypothetical protein
VVLLDDTSDVGARNERRFAAVYVDTRRMGGGGGTPLWAVYGVVCVWCGRLYVSLLCMLSLFRTNTVSLSFFLRYVGQNTSGLSAIHGLVDRIMELMAVRFCKGFYFRVGVVKYTY